jgi:hypothetical protein
MGRLIGTTNANGQSRFHLLAVGQTVRLTQLDMVDSFAVTKQKIALHLKNLDEYRELAGDSVVKELLATAADDKRHQTLGASCRLRCDATIKQSLTVRTKSKPHATTEEFSVVACVGNGHAMQRAKVLDQRCTRHRLPSSVRK